MKKTSKKTPVASICLYGNYYCGSGYIASTKDGRMFGDGEPKAGRTSTDALLLACMDLRDAGIHGTSTVHIDTIYGPRVALVNIDHPTFFGDLIWKDAEPAVVISAEQVMAMAEKA